MIARIDAPAGEHQSAARERHRPRALDDQQFGRTIGGLAHHDHSGRGNRLGFGHSPDLGGDPRLYQPALLSRTRASVSLEVRNRVLPSSPNAQLAVALPVAIKPSALPSGERT